MRQWTRAEEISRPCCCNAPFILQFVHFSTADWLEQSRRPVIWIISSNSYSNGLSSGALNVFLWKIHEYEVKLLVFRGKFAVNGIFCFFLSISKVLVVTETHRLSYYVSKLVKRCLL